LSLALNQPLPVSSLGRGGRDSPHPPPMCSRVPAGCGRTSRSGCGRRRRARRGRCCACCDRRTAQKVSWQAHALRCARCRPGGSGQGRATPARSPSMRASTSPRAPSLPWPAGFNSTPCLPACLPAYPTCLPTAELLEVYASAACEAHSRIRLAAAESLPGVLLALGMPRAWDTALRVAAALAVSGDASVRAALAAAMPDLAQQAQCAEQQAVQQGDGSAKGGAPMDDLLPMMEVRTRNRTRTGRRLPCLSCPACCACVRERGNPI
jgi:hypothetical protein